MAITEQERKIFLTLGKQKEQEFINMLSNHEFASKEQDIKEHWDLKFSIRIDVKSLKKDSRNDKTPNEDIHWIELSNVNGGKCTGWLYAELVDYFAFETIDYWILVSKMKLQDFIEKKCKGKKIEHSKELYTLYSRAGRRDIIVKIKTLDLCYLSDEIYLKTLPLNSLKNYQLKNNKNSNEVVLKTPKYLP